MVFPLTKTRTDSVFATRALKIADDDQAGINEQVLPVASWCSPVTSCCDSAFDSSDAQAARQSSCDSAVATAETLAAKECSVTWFATIRYDLADSCVKVICVDESYSYLECEKAVKAS